MKLLGSQGSLTWECKHRAGPTHIFHFHFSWYFIFSFLRAQKFILWSKSQLKWVWSALGIAFLLTLLTEDRCLLGRLASGCIPIEVSTVCCYFQKLPFSSSICPSCELGWTSKVTCWWCPDNWAKAVASVWSTQTCALHLWNTVEYIQKEWPGTAGQTGLLQGREVGFGFLTIPFLCLEVMEPRWLHNVIFRKRRSWHACHLAWSKRIFCSAQPSVFPALQAKQTTPYYLNSPAALFLQTISKC